MPSRSCGGSARAWACSSMTENSWTGVLLPELIHGHWRCMNDISFLRLPEPTNSVATFIQHGSPFVLAPGPCNWYLGIVAA